MTILLKNIHRQIILILILTNILYLIWTHPKLNLNYFKYSNSRLFCIILIRPNPEIKRLSTIYNAWAKYCDDYVYVAKLEPGYQNLKMDYKILEPSLLDIDAYKNLTSKVLFAFHDVYLKYKGYDWYLKADDDSFIFVENLKDFLSTKNKSELLTYGFSLHYRSWNNLNTSYQSGGAGYVLGEEAMMRLGNQLVTNKSICFPNDTSGYEDEDVARCLHFLGVKSGNSLDEYGRERFHLFAVIDHIYGFYPLWIRNSASNPLKNGTSAMSDQTVSFHYLEEDIIAKLGKFWQKYLKKLKNGEKLKPLSYYLYDIY